MIHSTAVKNTSVEPFVFKYLFWEKLCRVFCFFLLYSALFDVLVCFGDSMSVTAKKRGKEIYFSFVTRNACDIDWSIQKSKLI